MTARRHYITTTIPHVNARPHLGFRPGTSRRTPWPAATATTATRSG